MNRRTSPPGPGDADQHEAGNRTGPRKRHTGTEVKKPGQSHENKDKKTGADGAERWTAQQHTPDQGTSLHATGPQTNRSGGQRTTAYQLAASANPKTPLEHTTEGPTTASKPQGEHSHMAHDPRLAEALAIHSR